MTIPAPITAYFRTQNEALSLARALEAARLVADEIIVVDSGSTDGTAELAERLGARVIRQSWLGSGRQKRVAEDAARNHWLLDLDADEVVTPELAAEMTGLFRDGAPAESVFRTPMAYAPPFGAPWIGFGGVTRHKLYDRRIVRQPDHEAWDQFDPPEGARIGRLASPILHYAWRDTGHLVDKVNRNSSTRARILAARSPLALSARILFGLPVYIGKRLFLDGLFRGGVQGFAFAAVSGFGKWLRDVKMYERVMVAREIGRGGSDPQ